MVFEELLIFEREEWGREAHRCGKGANSYSLPLLRRTENRAYLNNIRFFVLLSKERSCSIFLQIDS